MWGVAYKPTILASFYLLSFGNPHITMLPYFVFIFFKARLLVGFKVVITLNFVSMSSNPFVYHVVVSMK